MAYTTIDDPSAHFQVDLYTGEGNGTVITNDGNSDLQPDLVWFKRRGGLGYHQIIDSSRGVTKRLWANDDGPEGTQNQLASFDSDGFTCGSSTDLAPADTCVAWQWKANGGTTTSGGGNDSVSTSAYQANTTAGFSIVTYTGTGSAATVAHGLGVAPQVVLVKRRDGSDACWDMYHAGVDETDAAQLDTTAAFYDSASYWNDTAPTSSVFTVGSSGETNGSGNLHIAYCWAPIQGYSHFGKYIGSGNANGPFIYTGFKPAYVLIKATDVDEWRIYDHKRSNPFNVINVRLKAHSNAAESQDDNECDFFSNGIKIRSDSGGVNSTNQAYVYLAFAEQPFVTSTGIPATAR